MPKITEPKKIPTYINCIDCGVAYSTTDPKGNQERIKKSLEIHKNCKNVIKSDYAKIKEN